MSLDNLGAGMSIDEILDDFPELTKADVQACLIFEMSGERMLRPK